MRRTASEVLNDLEIRVAHLEKEAGLWRIIKTNIFRLLGGGSKIAKFVTEFGEHIQDNLRGVRGRVVTHPKTAQYEFSFRKTLNLTCTIQVEMDKRHGFATSAMRVSLYLQSAVGESTGIDYGNGGLTKPLLVSEYDPGLTGEFHDIEENTGSLLHVVNEDIKGLELLVRREKEEAERSRLEDRLWEQGQERNHLKGQGTLEDWRALQDDIKRREQEREEHESDMRTRSFVSLFGHKR